MAIQPDIADLVSRHAARLDHTSRAAATGASGIQAIILMPLVSWGACLFLDRQSARLADQSVWFQGLAVKIGNSRSDDTDIKPLLDAVERAQLATQKLHASTVDGLQKILAVKRFPKVEIRLQTMLENIAALHDSIEHARWSVLELETDADIARGDVARFNSPEDLFADLDR